MARPERRPTPIPSQRLSPDQNTAISPPETTDAFILVAAHPRQEVARGTLCTSSTACMRPTTSDAALKVLQGFEPLRHRTDPEYQDTVWTSYSI